MDDSGQVQAVVSFLAPYLPYLIAGATEVAKGAAKKVGEIGTESAWKKAQALWARIRRRRDPDLDTKVQVVALDPTEEVYLAVLARYLMRFLEAQPELAAELSVLLEGDPDVKEVIARNKGIVERVVQIGPGTKRVEADTGGRVGSVWQES